ALAAAALRHAEQPAQENVTATPEFPGPRIVKVVRAVEPDALAGDGMIDAGGTMVNELQRPIGLPRPRDGKPIAQPLDFRGIFGHEHLQPGPRETEFLLTGNVLDDPQPAVFESLPDLGIEG